MKVKGNKRSKIALLVGFTGATLLASGFFATYAMAQVKGKCENCHTMHNSQDGNTQVHVGLNAGWNTGTNTLTNGDSFGERAQLLKSDCIGCHTATSASTTIINDGNNKVPIVFNRGGTYPANALAGGNFALNTGSANVYGHNVFGISNPDSISFAPGAGVSCGVSCHDSLALSDAATTSTFNYMGVSQGNFNGCKACHNKVGHHNPNDPSYRFLGGHNEAGGVDVVKGSEGAVNFEDPNWEVAPTAATHNIYKNQTDKNVKDSMGAFCAGCHQDFHALGKGVDMASGVDNGGDDNTDNKIVQNSTPINPWLRHPTNVDIPLDDVAGEYNVMKFQPYNPAVPVAQDPLLGTVSHNQIDNTDQVMCLSCHRAHASEYPDALRFNYSKMNAHNAAAIDLNSGCFFCHQNKDS